MVNFQIADEIEFRPFIEENAVEIFAAVKANYAHLKPFLHWVTEDYSLESASEFINRTQKAFAENTSQTFGIFCREKIVGVIGFVNFNWSSKRTEIGYWITQNYEGQGIITKSCKALIKYAFNDLKMNRIEIHCATENIKSRAIPERLNFTLEGVLRQSEWRHARFYDMAIYGMLAEEWSGD
jgi:ribosomal-protein-serine acetyltransferase